MASYGDHILTFTDGSKVGEGVGCAFVTGNTTRSFSLPGNSSVFTSEIVAISNALCFIELSDEVSHLIFFSVIRLPPVVYFHRHEKAHKALTHNCQKSHHHARTKHKDSCVVPPGVDIRTAAHWRCAAHINLGIGINLAITHTAKTRKKTNQTYKQRRRSTRTKISTAVEVLTQKNKLVIPLL